MMKGASVNNGSMDAQIPSGKSSFIWIFTVIVFYTSFTIITHPVSAEVGTSCNTTDQCGPNIDCAENQCVCNNGFYDSNGMEAGGSCLNKKGLTETGCNPLVSDSCLDVNSTCYLHKCVCNTGFFDSSGTCIPQIGLGLTCLPESIDSCSDQNAICMSGMCSCGSGYYDNNGNTTGGRCVEQIELGGKGCSDATSEACEEKQSECIEDTCVCRQGFYDSNDDHVIGGHCIHKRNLGDSCSGYHHCEDDNAVCLQYACACDVVFYDSNGFAPSGECKAISLLQVSDITFELVTTEVFYLRWTPPLDSHLVSGYLVSWFPNNNSLGTLDRGSFSTGNRTTISIHNLVPGQAYVVTVTSRNLMTARTERVTSVSIVHGARPSQPGPVDLERSDRNASNFILAWLVLPGSMSSMYHIDFIDYQAGSRNVLYSVSVNSTTVSFPDNVRQQLLHGHEYRLELYSESMPYMVDGVETTEHSSTYTEIVKTLVTEPDPPISASCPSGPADLVAGNITLTWTPPVYSNGELVEYAIQVYEYLTPDILVKTVMTGSTETQFTVTQLRKGWYYQFEIFTVNEEYWSRTGARTPPNILQYCETKAEKSEKVFEPTCSVTSRSLTCSWQRPRVANGEILGYVTHLLNSAGQCIHEEVTSCHVCVKSFTIPTSTCSSDVRDVSLANRTAVTGPQMFQTNDLHPDTEYRVSIATLNAAGKGQDVTLMVRTLEEVPQKPHSIRPSDIQATSLVVNWDIDGPRPGITTYRIELHAEEPAVSHWKEVTGFESRSVLFTGLEEYWNYDIVVSASTSVGNNVSMPVPVRTLSAEPGEVRNLTVDPIKDVYDNMQVKWRGPDILNQNGHIVTYNVTMETDIGQNNTEPSYFINVPAVSREIVYVVLVPVEPGVKYKLKVYAINEENQQGPPIDQEFKPNDPPEVENLPLIVGISVACVFLLLVIFLSAMVYRRRRNPEPMRQRSISSPSEPRELTTLPPPLERNDDQIQPMNGGMTDGEIQDLGPLEFPFRDLEITTERLGTGHFSDVFRGYLTTGGERHCVAVKYFIDSSHVLASKQYKRELEEIEEIGSHPNIVPLMGYCCINGRVYLAYEYQQIGSLLAYIRASRPITHAIYGEDTQVQCNTKRLTLEETWGIILDVTRGMQHLAHKKVVHGNLAARNVLLDTGMVAKITDYALSRADETKRTSTVESRIPGKKSLLRWMAPESLKDGIFSTETDVWSFGIVLWEIVTLGETPYATMNLEDLAEKVPGGYRPFQPENCGVELYEVMLQCWEANPSERPSFAHLEKILKRMCSEQKCHIRWSTTSTTDVGSACV